MGPLDYSVVVATRNRPSALKLSLPLLLDQTRPAKQIIVVDSSDDPEPARALIRELNAANDLQIEYVTSAKGSSLQRNIGLDMVTAPVVLFPDDDSLLYPDAMEHIMDVYERDTEELIGGVCGLETTVPPVGTIEQAEYSLNTWDRIKQHIGPLIHLASSRIVPEPTRQVARASMEARQAPEWIDGDETALVEWMTGFRMSFRTDVIRQHRFNEAMGSYALFEDRLACMTVLHSHVLVGAHKALIYHHRFPARRDRGYVMGAMSVLNRAYAIAKSGSVNPETEALTHRFNSAEIIKFSTAFTTKFGRDRFQGARAAARRVPALFSASPEDLEDVYLSVRQEIGLE